LAQQPGAQGSYQRSAQTASSLRAGETVRDLGCPAVRSAALDGTLTDDDVVAEDQPTGIAPSLQRQADARNGLVVRPSGRAVEAERLAVDQTSGDFETQRQEGDPGGGDDGRIQGADSRKASVSSSATMAICHSRAPPARSAAVIAST
jgi:hypothetical protein